MGDWKRQPTLHFLLIGAVLFVVSAVLGGFIDRRPSRPGVGSGSREIVVSEDVVVLLSDAWESRWRRPPTEAELEALIDDWVRQEVLFRSARELRLDEGDPIVRRRMVEKMELLAAPEPVEPTEEQLRELYETDPDRWARPARRSYTHIFFDEAIRGEAAWQDAQAVLEELSVLEPAPPRAPELGDPFPMQFDYPNRTREDLARHMGEAFAERVFELDPETWHGPLRSEYGVHLVRITDSTDTQSVDFEAARGRIREELARERAREADERFYEQLKVKYEIVRGDDN